MLRVGAYVLCVSVCVRGASYHLINSRQYCVLSANGIGVCAVRLGVALRSAGPDQLSQSHSRLLMTQSPIGVLLTFILIIINIPSPLTLSFQTVVFLSSSKLTT